MPLPPASCQYIFSAECGWCTPIVPASRGQNQRITPKFEFSQMCACSPHLPGLQSKTGSPRAKAIRQGQPKPNTPKASTPSANR